MTWAAILALGLASGTLSGIVGFGASIMLMPVLMLAFGPQEAGPIMAIAALLANVSRVLVWWREIDWRANAYYCATGVPMAALGARSLLVLDPRLVEGFLGALFLVMIPARRWLRSLLLMPWAAQWLPAVAIPKFLTPWLGSIAPAHQHEAWRYTLMSGLIPAIPLMIIRPFLPESFQYREHEMREATMRFIISRILVQPFGSVGARAIEQPVAKRIFVQLRSDERLGHQTAQRHGGLVGVVIRHLRHGDYVLLSECSGEH